MSNTNTPAAPEMTHRFAHLAAPPYTFVGCAREVFQAIPGDPNCPLQPGASCDYCGQGIFDVYRFKGSDGRVFKVGCDCAGRAGDAGMRRAVDAAKRKVDAQKREAGKARKADALATLLADDAVRAALSAKPSSIAWRAAEGDTLLDEVTWLASRCGAAGVARLVKRIKAEVGA